MSLSTKIAAIFITVVILTRVGVYLKESSLPNPNQQNQTQQIQSTPAKPAPKPLMRQKDVTGTTFNVFLERNLQRYIRKQGTDGWFSILSTGPKEWADKGHAIKPVRRSYQIRPFKIETSEIQLGAYDAADGIDLKVLVEITGDLCKVKDEGKPWSEWKNGIPRLPKYYIIRKKGGEFRWSEYNTQPGDSMSAI